MPITPFRSTLYRTRLGIVISAGLVWVASSASYAQFARQATVSKGPRALALVVLPAKGKPHLTPIAIMVEGHFYDAGAYKADPVPMALEAGTVYEVERTGESLGLFTVGQAFEQQSNWFAEGSYHAKGEKVASNAHKAEAKPRQESEEGPPKLRRPGSGAPEPSKSATEAKAESPPAGQGSSEAKVEPKGEPEASPEDPNIPRLRRGAPESTRDAGEAMASASPARGGTNLEQETRTRPIISSGAAKAVAELIPAISDADGPDPHSYVYLMKPEEEQAFRTKMLAMAGEQLRTEAREFRLQSSTSPRARAGTKLPAKLPQPTFDLVELHVFDVAGSNEPVLVLTARAHPAQSRDGEEKAVDYYLALVARSDIYGELRKLYAAVTDSNHLDVNPRLELMDAVDADGDGRGELVFRQVSDRGSAYAIYRVTPDRLWPLYEGTPQ
ncbi:MAG: hypothetical protein JO266_20650 [Acidobacteria bacterium]|nr:hypothetical protein [Acidobacteriota bacterium]